MWLSLLQLAFVFGGSLLIALLLAKYLVYIYQGKTNILLTPLRWLEKIVYKLSGVQEETEMNWRDYTKAILFFNLIGFLVLLGILVNQAFLPLNPNDMPPVPFWLALNTAISFVTNTNWQAYSGEATLSYFSQMAGLGVQNFLSAATGMAVAVAFARGFSRKTTQAIGNAWVDITKSTVYILLPFCFLMAVALMSQGVIQNFSKNLTIQTLEHHEQVLPMGPVASQIAIKQIGSNGGGYFGVNSAHPYENPTPFSNLLELMAILVLPMAFPLVWGDLAGFSKHGKTVLVVMFGFLILHAGIALHYEHHFLPGLSHLKLRVLTKS